MPRPRLLIPTVLLASLVLVSCAAGPDPVPTDDGADGGAEAAAVDVCATPGGDAVDGIVVTGEFGSPPTVEFEPGVDAPEQTQRTILIDGGVPVAPGANVEARYTLINATTGETIDQYGYADGEAPTAFRADVAALRAGFAKTLGCVGPGSRVVGVIPPAEGFAEAATDSGVAEDDVLIFVADVVTDLSPAEWTVDIPEVGGTADAPTLTLPNAPAREELELTVLTEGEGASVGAADSVTVDYYGVAWETGDVFDESYSGEPATFSVTGVVPGFAAALIGQKVGSRILVTMPPALGYGEAGTSGSELAGLTLVFLIDIVDTSSATP